MPQQMPSSLPCVDPIWLQKTRTDHSLFLRGKVPSSLIYFEGHFAEFPLVPGVIELQWVVDLLPDFFTQGFRIVRVDNLKFQKFLRPNDEMELSLNWDSGKSRVQFQLKTAGEMCGSGFVVLAFDDEPA